MRCSLFFCEAGGRGRRLHQSPLAICGDCIAEPKPKGFGNGAAACRPHLHKYQKIELAFHDKVTLITEVISGEKAVFIIKYTLSGVCKRFKLLKQQSDKAVYSAQNP